MILKGLKMVIFSNIIGLVESKLFFGVVLMCKDVLVGKDVCLILWLKEDKWED